jgi:CheY-like chemotaxis protein
MEELRARPECGNIPVIVITAKVLPEDDRRRRRRGRVERSIEKGSPTPADVTPKIRTLLNTVP